MGVLRPKNMGVGQTNRRHVVEDLRSEVPLSDTLVLGAPCSV